MLWLRGISVDDISGSELGEGRERSPLGRGKRLPEEGRALAEGGERSPEGGERSPEGGERSPEGRGRSPEEALVRGSPRSHSSSPLRNLFYLLYYA